MALNLNDRSFVRGSTVHLRARVSQPGTKVPAAATVVLTSLRTGDTTLEVTDTVFTGEGTTGEYVLTIPTAPLAAGTYTVVVTVSDGPAKVVVLTDTFVVTEP